jgi:hypothetical protein
MCRIEKGKKVSDCGLCHCRQSTRWGKHDRVATGEKVKIGGQEIPTYKCRMCGTYLN